MPCPLDLVQSKIAMAPIGIFLPRQARGSAKRSEVGSEAALEQIKTDMAPIGVYERRRPIRLRGRSHQALVLSRIVGPHILVCRKELVKGSRVA